MSPAAPLGHSTLDPLVVSGGGAGVTSADLDELLVAAHRLTEAASRLAAVGSRLAAAELALCLDPLPLEHSGTRAAAQARTALALAGPHGVGAAVVRLERLGREVQAAGAAYRAADAAAAAALLAASALQVPVELPALAVLAKQAGPLVGWPDEGAGLDVEVSAAAVPAAAPTGVGDLVSRLAGLDSAAVGSAADGTASPPGTVRVECVTSPTGRRAWVVVVPGVHSWNPDPGAVPMDFTGAVRSLGGASDTSQDQLVVRAMEIAGVKHGEPVLLVGHSLGGMVAANLAADPAFRQRFSVTHVVTAGSPIGLTTVPPSVDVLSLEHVEDVVPRLDSTLNPGRRSWTTVTTRTPRVAPVEGAGGRCSPHDARGYAATGRRVDESTDPALVRYRTGLAPFLAGDGVTDVALEVTGRRPAPPPPPPPAEEEVSRRRPAARY